MIKHPTIPRRGFLLGTAGVTGAVLLGACSTNDDDGGTSRGSRARLDSLRLPGSDSGFPSPFATRRGNTKSTFIYDTLVWKAASGDHVLLLADSFEGSDGGRTNTFTLRPNLTWHDGRPLTADDVAFTFGYFQSQTLSPQVLFQPAPQIQEVRAIDDRTVEFRLSEPLADFFGFAGVGSVPIIPRHIWSSVRDASKENDPAVLVGSGPYRLQSYSEGEGSYVYTANDQYFLGAPFVRRLEYRPVNDELEGLAAGELDVASAGGVVPAVLEPFRRNPDLTVIDAPPGNSGSGLFWNLARGGALADPVFRRACARAIDRNELVQRLYGGNGNPGNPGWIPRENPFHVDVEQYPFDRDAANRQLDQAGYGRGPDGVRQAPDGTPLRYSLLLTSGDSQDSQLADLLVGALQPLGVELTPQALDTPTFNERVINEESEMSIIGFGGMNTDHGSDYLLQVYSSKTQTTQHAQGYVNPEVDRLCDEQQSELDEAKRMDIVARIQPLIAEDLPILPLAYPSSFTIFNKKTFDQWYYTVGGVLGTVPAIDNKLVFISGKKAGPDLRRVEQGN